MRVFQTEDGYTFYEHDDGTLTDSPSDDLETSDLLYNSLEELEEQVDVVEIDPTEEMTPGQFKRWRIINHLLQTRFFDDVDLQDAITILETITATEKGLL